MDEKTTTPRPIYTIRYGARDIEDLVAVLKEHQIAFLVDVRSQPYSRYKTEFTKDALAHRLKQTGVQYVFMGDTMGGRPADPDCYDDDGKVNYKKYRHKDSYLEGIERLKRAWQQQLPVVIMCSEGKPENCHRSELIGRSLEADDIAVAHIDENGALISQKDAESRRRGGQLSLFPSLEQSTSRKKYKPDATGSDDGTFADDD
jgi:uncharacterized protein (DUF488 family)